MLYSTATSSGGTHGAIAWRTSRTVTDNTSPQAASLQPQQRGGLPGAAFALACRIAMWYTLAMRKITAIRLDDAGRAALHVIRERYGVVSDSDASRLAVRLVAESTRVDLRQERDDHGRGEPAQD